MQRTLPAADIAGIRALAVPARDGYRSPEGKLVKLPYRVSKKTLRLAVTRVRSLASDLPRCSLSTPLLIARIASMFAGCWASFMRTSASSTSFRTTEGMPSLACAAMIPASVGKYPRTSSAPMPCPTGRITVVPAICLLVEPSSSACGQFFAQNAWLSTSYRTAYLQLALRTCWLFFVHQKAPIGGLLLIGQLAFRFSERLVKEMILVNEGGCGGQIYRVSWGS